MPTNYIDALNFKCKNCANEFHIDKKLLKQCPQINVKWCVRCGGAMELEK